MHNLRLALAASAALIIGASAPALAQDSLTLSSIVATDIGHDLDTVASPTLTAARVLRAAPAEWPAFEQLANLSGKAEIEVGLDASGRLTDAAVVESSGHRGFDRSALAAVRASTYRPATINGQAVGGRYIIEVAFDPSI